VDALAEGGGGCRLVRLIAKDDLAELIALELQRVSAARGAKMVPGQTN